MTEAQLLRAIREAAKAYRWPCVYHTYDSRRSERGFPDVFISGYGTLLAWELKSKNGHPTASQRLWIKTLGEVTDAPLVRVVRPADLDWCIEILKRRGV